jgi:hypothetical protein
MWFRKFYAKTASEDMEGRVFQTGKWTGHRAVLKNHRLNRVISLTARYNKINIILFKFELGIFRKHKK